MNQLENLIAQRQALKDERQKLRAELTKIAQGSKALIGRARHGTDFACKIKPSELNRMRYIEKLLKNPRFKELEAAIAEHDEWIRRLKIQTPEMQAKIKKFEAREGGKIICELPKKGDVVLNFNADTQTFRNEVAEHDPKF